MTRTLDLLRKALGKNAAETKIADLRRRENEYVRLEMLKNRRRNTILLATQSRRRRQTPVLARPAQPQPSFDFFSYLFEMPRSLR